MSPRETKLTRGDIRNIVFIASVTLVAIVVAVLAARSTAGNTEGGVPSFASNPHAMKLTASGEEVESFSSLSGASDNDLTELSASHQFRLATLNQGGGLASVGHASISDGTRISTYANRSQICLIAATGDALNFNPGVCHTLKAAIEGRVNVSAPSNGEKWRIVGLAPDGVQRVQLVGTDTESKVISNGYEFELTPQPVVLAGVSESGEELFRTSIPLDDFAKE